MPSERAGTLTHEHVIGGKNKGLWGDKSMQLPAYIQHVANDLIQSGHPKERAIPMAIGIVKNWAAGHDGHGNKVSAETQAKAVAAVAEWEALKAKAKATPNKNESRRSAVEYSRFLPVEFSFRSGMSADGRTVEAYAAVFDVPVPIRDADGEYEETLDRACFTRAIDHARPKNGRKAWRVGVFYNHARTLFGTPSERHSEPIGVCQHMETDTRGLMTVTKYLPSADRYLEAMREGAITAYSFSGSFMRSSPEPSGRFGKYRPDSSGRLPSVRRLESSLREYGPTPFPAYVDAEVVAVRAETVAAQLFAMPAAERARLAGMLTGEMFDDDNDEVSGTSDGSEPAAGDPPPADGEHSIRHHAHRLYQLRSEELLEQAGIVLRERSVR